MEFYVNLAKTLSEESVGLRFRAKSLALAFFLEFFATRQLIRFLSLRYGFVYSLPTDRQDIENHVRGHFPDDLANPLLSLIDVSESDFPQWFRRCLPEGMTEEQFSLFLAYGAAAIKRWKSRYQQELHTLGGVEWVSFLVARLIQTIIVIGIVWTHSTLVVGLLLVAMMVSAVVCVRGIPVT